MFNLGFRTRRAENAPQIKRDLQLAVLADISSARHGIGTVAAAYDKLYDEIARRMPRGVTFAVTSAERAEGRTSIAASLACAAVRQGKTVLLIDADLRRPQLHDLFAHTGMSIAPGLVEMLVGNLASPSDAVHESGIPGLYVVPAGRMQVSDASALLESPTMLRMLKSHLPQLADIIIIDTPPVHAGEPGSKIIHQADGVIIALRVGHSQMPSCKNVLTTLQRSGARVFGGVLVPAGEGNTGPVLAHVETPDVDLAAVIAPLLPDVPTPVKEPIAEEPLVIRIVAVPPTFEESTTNVVEALEGQPLAVLASDETLVQRSSVDDVPQGDAPVDGRGDIDDDVEEVLWVSTNDDDAAIAVISFGDDVAHREAVTLLEETSEPTVAAQTDIEEVLRVSTNDDDAAIAVISFGDDVAHREAVTPLEETNESTVAAQTDIDEVLWVSTNDDDAAIADISFGDDVAQREFVTPLEETGEPTVAAQTDVVDDISGIESTLDRDTEQDESATMDEPSGGTDLPADKLSDLLATWRRGAYDVAFVQPVVPVIDEPLTITPVIEVIDNADPLSIVVETAVADSTVEVKTVTQVLDPIAQAATSSGIEALEMTFSMVPTGASEMTLRAESTNHGELGCLPIHLEMAMLVSAMRGMQAETPGPDATDGLRALLETKSSSANDNTALRLRIGSLDAPRIDATLHGDGICHVRAGETRGDTQVSISAPDGGTSSIVATTSLAPMDGRAVITLEREVLRRPYGDVRYINRIRLQLTK